jgi:hypothetical protein
MKSKTMGAIRVSVKLTNAGDETLVSRGSLAPQLLRVCETQALVDTGALTLVIPPDIREQLGLRFGVSKLLDMLMGLRSLSESPIP